jgi:hypothetical protein
MIISVNQKCVKLRTGNLFWGDVVGRHVNASCYKNNSCIRKYLKG